MPASPETTLMVGTANYLEIQEPSSGAEAGLSFTYVNILEPGRFIVSCCWGHEFDRFAPFLSDPKMGSYWLEAYSEPWPTFGRSLRNSSHGRLSDGCLVNFQDPDDGEQKWHVVTYVGNLPSTSSWSDIAEEERILQACRLVYIRSAELAEDMMSGRDISGGMKAKGLLKGALGAQAEAVETSLVWLEKIDRISRLLSV
ncbi:MAG: hypothetical protein WKF73_10325 [Nocardioidaceae bacterium]